MTRRRGNQLAGVVMLLALALATYFAFHPSLPFTHGYRLRAVVHSANQLRAGSPVRIAGVDVGKVGAIGSGPGSTTTLTLDIQPRGLPIHRDATLRIRPRVFLEGGFYVELHPGSPTAPELGSDATIPLAQTTGPVQLSQLLSVFDAPIRQDLRGGLAELATGISGGGARGLRAVAPRLAPALRDLAWVAQAARGRAPHDVSTLIAAGSRVGGALASDPLALAGLVTSFRVTAQALSADDHALADSLSGLDDLARTAPAGLRALDGALPVLTRVSGAALPAVRVAPGALRQTAGVLGQLGALVAPAARERTISGLRTTFVDLPTLIVGMASLFPTVKPLSDCLRSHIVPLLSQTVPDGALSSGRPAWQDFAHALVGLTSAAQNFDGDGYSVRYLFGAGPEGLSTADLPGIGTLSTSASSPLQSRPLPPAGGEPPLRADVDCLTQPLPTLDTPVGSAGLQPSSAGSAP
jgi:ABC-type transporter Mla subunit MlaD